MNVTRSPSIKIVVKITDAFDINIDCLIGNGKHAVYDKDVIERMEDIRALDSDTRATLFNAIHTYLRDYKAPKTYAK